MMLITYYFLNLVFKIGKQQFRKELETQENLYSHLKTQHEEGKHDTLWKDIDTNW